MKKIEKSCEKCLTFSQVLHNRWRNENLHLKMTLEKVRADALARLEKKAKKGQKSA